MSLGTRQSRVKTQGILWKNGFLVMLGLALWGCGQGTDPIAGLGDPSNSAGPGLILPLSNTLTQFQPFSSSNPGFNLIGTFTGTIVPVRAPGSGFVISSDTAGQSVTILHTVHLYSKVGGVTPTGITVGSYIQSGAQIGAVANAVNTISFSVIVDGVAVCPLSYLTTGARQQLITTVYGSIYNSSPCLP